MGLKIFFVILLMSNAQCGNILGIFPLAGLSHHLLAVKLMKGLAEAGHNITMVSPYATNDPPKNGKIVDIILDGVAVKYQETLKNFNLFQGDGYGVIDSYVRLTDFIIENCNQTLHHPKMKELVQTKQKFDVIIMEQFMNDALKIYSHIFECPLIVFSSTGPHSAVNPTVGNSQPVSYVLHIKNAELSNCSFQFRLKNLYLYIMEYFVTKLYSLPINEQIMKAVYPHAPSIPNLYTNVSLLLLNSHSSVHSPVPLVPNMVEIGGYHIDPPKKLPEDLQEYMDNATQGIIYFSMGSNLRSKDLPKERIQAFLNVFGKLKQKIIWKFEEELPNKISNVLIRKWYPQHDILAHPNVKLFITHGGLLSIMETIYHGVPILAIPVFHDQPANAARAEAHGYALKLQYLDPEFSENKLEYLINKLLNNPKYTQNARKRSKLYHDRPMKPMEVATYWVDYVIRHGGASHLRVAGSRLPWYEYFMIDVFVFLALIFILVFYFIKVSIKQVFNRRSKSKTSKKLKSK